VCSCVRYWRWGDAYRKTRLVICYEEGCRWPRKGSNWWALSCAVGSTCRLKKTSVGIYFIFCTLLCSFAFWNSLFYWFIFIGTSCSQRLWSYDLTVLYKSIIIVVVAAAAAAVVVTHISKCWIFFLAIGFCFCCPWLRVRSLNTVTIWQRIAGPWLCVSALWNAFAKLTCGLTG